MRRTIRTAGTLVCLTLLTFGGCAKVAPGTATPQATSSSVETPTVMPTPESIPSIPMATPTSPATQTPVVTTSTTSGVTQPATTTTSTTSQAPGPTLDVPEKSDQELARIVWTAGKAVSTPGGGDLGGRRWAVQADCVGEAGSTLAYDILIDNSVISRAVFPCGNAGQITNTAFFGISGTHQVKLAPGATSKGTVSKGYAILVPDFSAGQP